MLKAKLDLIENIVVRGIDADGMLKIMEEIGLPGYDKALLKDFKLWSDYMPLADDMPYTEEQRYLHMLWEFIDRVPLGINCAFSIPFRQIIAKKLFKKCGEGLVANEGIRFNFGNLIEVGDNVSWNHACYFDSKGGITFGSNCMITEYTKIFTHSHSEYDHMERSYAPVEIGEYAKVYTACTILPGVKIGKGAIVATGAIVTKNVDDFTLVAGIPAKPMRKRNAEFSDIKELNHYMLKDKFFQN